MSLTRFAVIGAPIAHSLSPLIHQLFAEQTGKRLIYEKILLDETNFEQQVRQFFMNGGHGLNITHPGKLRARALCDAVTTRALHAGAVNTIWQNDAGQLMGDNTDGIGFITDISRYLDLDNKSVLLLGAGGAAHGILSALIDAKPSRIVITNRTHAKAEALAKAHPPATAYHTSQLEGHFDLIIHATATKLPLTPLSALTTHISKNTFCYDLQYDLTRTTPFVQWAHAHHCSAMDGLGMLLEQAAAAYNIWHHVLPDTQQVMHHLQTMQSHKGAIDRI
jgi:shikimate dehydrogenase